MVSLMLYYLDLEYEIQVWWFIVVLKWCELWTAVTSSSRWREASWRGGAAGDRKADQSVSAGLCWTTSTNARTATRAVVFSRTSTDSSSGHCQVSQLPFNGRMRLDCQAAMQKSKQSHKLLIQHSVALSRHVTEELPFFTRMTHTLPSGWTYFSRLFFSVHDLNSLPSCFLFLFCYSSAPLPVLCLHVLTSPASPSVRRSAAVVFNKLLVFCIIKIIIIIIIIITTIL